MTKHTAAVVGCAWHDRGSELAFVTRSIAGAATRAGTVVVLVPGEQGQLEADGAFDLQSMGSPGAPAWPVSLRSDAVVIVDELTPELAVSAARSGAASLLYISSPPAVRPPSPVGGVCSWLAARTHSAPTYP